MYGPPPGQRQEFTLHQSPGLLVSTVRLVVGTTTYPLAGITAVTHRTVPPNRALALVLILLGLPMAAASAAVGGCMLIAGIALLFLLKAKHVLRLATAGGQVDALVSTDAGYITTVAATVNHALIQRG